EKIENSVVIFCLYHQVAGVKFPLPGDPLAASHLDDSLHGDDDLSKKILKSFNLDAALDALFDRFLSAALNFHHVPMFVAGLRGAIFRRLLARTRWLGRRRRRLGRNLSARPTLRRLRFGSWQIGSHDIGHHTLTREALWHYPIAEFGQAIAPRQFASKARPNLGRPQTGRASKAGQSQGQRWCPV